MEPSENIRFLCRKHSEERAKAAKVLHEYADADFIGRHVKMQFETGDEDHPGEHMWVIVKQAINGTFKGTLDNIPIVATAIKYGDEVVFSKEQVEAVLPMFEKDIKKASEK